MKKHDLENPIEGVLEYVHTQEGVLMLIRGIEVLERSLYRSHQDSFEKILEKEIPQGIASILRDLFASPSYANDVQKRGEFLSLIKEKLMKLQSLRLEIAFEPTERIAEEFVHWIRREIRQDLVVEFVVDPLVLGGARMIFNGRYCDFSLHRMIDDLMANKKSEIDKFIQLPRLA